MSKPLIGITTDQLDRRFASPVGYATAVAKAGGLPVLLPYGDVSLLGEWVDRLDGFVFSGGDDLDPSCFGEAYHPKTVPVDPGRERFERALLAEVEKRRSPVLGICMGCQLMNLHRGGSLLQFLPDVTGLIEHRRLGEAERRHPVTLSASAALDAVGHAGVSANTSHKQAIDRVGQGLRVIATSPDGVIEGIEDPSLPMFLGVQWHPERLHGEADHLRLFELLIQRSSRC